ncbi:MAG: hypothetical protein JXB33_06265, partial [Clostridia bacterium]|nr:hypothetical protein [Clostridia bacterium]
MKKLININKQLLLKGILLSFCDAAAALGALTLALVLRLNSLDISAYNGDIMPFWLAYSAVVIIIYSIFGLYKSLWKFASVEEMVKLLFASASAATILFLINLRFGHNLPNSVPIIAFFVQAGLSGTARFSYRVLRLLRSKFKGNGKNDGGQHRTVVIGSGYEAVATIKS